VSTHKNLGPLRTSATVEASNLKFGTQIWFGTSLPKKDVQDQNWPRSWRGVHSKKLGPLVISATVETSNFKFGIQLGFETILPKKQHLGLKLAGGGPAPGDPLFISDATVYSTCHQNLTGTQISLLSGIKQKI